MQLNKTLFLALSLFVAPTAVLAQEATAEAVEPALMITLNSEEGQALLDKESAVDYPALAENWVAQLKSHCGAASAVVVQNSLLPGAGFTQDSLFTEETAHIITQDVVYRIGFTLEELTNMIATRSGLKTSMFHAGTEEGQHDYDAWIAALKKNRESADDHLIINFAVGWLRNRTNTGGHFSPIADYNEEENMVLVLEINAEREIFWVDAKELWDSMNQVDRVSGLVRGWIVVEKPEETGG